MKGYEEPYAKEFGEMGNMRSLGFIYGIQQIEKSINTKGRIPGIRPEYIRGKWGNLAEDPSVIDTFGTKAYFERCSGTVRASTKFIRSDEKGAVFRTDCFAIPEMWLEAHLTWEELDEVMKERPV